MPYVIRCYEGQDEWGAKKWLAHLNLGNDVYMSFLRGSKKEAEDAARNWYEAESKRFKHLDSSNMDDKPASVKVMNTNDGWGNGSQWTEEDLKNPPVVTFSDIGEIKVTKEHHFAGKVWMVGMKDGQKHKTRVDQSEVDKYIEMGYQKGGPRS